MKAQAFLLGYTSKEAKDDTEIISHDEGLEDLGLVDDNKAALDEPEDGQFDAAVDTEGEVVRQKVAGLAQNVGAVAKHTLRPAALGRSAVGAVGLTALIEKMKGNRAPAAPVKAAEVAPSLDTPTPRTEPTLDQMQKTPKLLRRPGAMDAATSRHIDGLLAPAGE